MNFALTFRSPWGYECQHSRCVKKEISELTNDALSLPVCKIFCGNNIGTLWPQPNGLVKLQQTMARITLESVSFNLVKKSGLNAEFWKENEQRLMKQIEAKVPHGVKLPNEGSRLMVLIDVEDENAKLNHQVNEHYHIEAYENTGVVLIKIHAETIFGARHAIETLYQLIVFDDIRNELLILGEFTIDDKPAFPHRGFLLDTSRNYFSVEAIKRTIGKGSSLMNNASTEEIF